MEPHLSGMHFLNVDARIKGVGPDRLKFLDLEARWSGRGVPAPIINGAFSRLHLLHGAQCNIPELLDLASSSDLAYTNSDAPQLHERTNVAGRSACLPVTNEQLPTDAGDGDRNKLAQKRSLSEVPHAPSVKTVDMNPASDKGNTGRMKFPYQETLPHRSAGYGNAHEQRKQSNAQLSPVPLIPSLSPSASSVPSLPHRSAGYGLASEYRKRSPSRISPSGSAYSSTYSLSPQPRKQSTEFEVDSNAAVQYEDFERELLSFDHSLLRHVIRQDKSLPRDSAMPSSASFEQSDRDIGTLDVKKGTFTLHDMIQEEILRFDKAHLRRTTTRVYNEPIVIEPLRSVDHASQGPVSKRTLSDWLDEPTSLGYEPTSLGSAPSHHAFSSLNNVPIKDASGGSPTKSTAFSGVIHTKSFEDVHERSKTVYDNDNAAMLQPAPDNEYFLAIAKQESNDELVSTGQKLAEQASLLLTPVSQQNGNIRRSEGITNVAYEFDVTSSSNKADAPVCRMASKDVDIARAGGISSDTGRDIPLLISPNSWNSSFKDESVHGGALVSEVVHLPNGSSHSKNTLYSIMRNEEAGGKRPASESLPRGSVSSLRPITGADADSGVEGSDTEWALMEEKFIIVRFKETDYYFLE